VIARHGLQWIATSGNVLRGCLAGEGGANPELNAWQAPGNPLYCYFRHDELSDLIGFSYSKWHGDDAVAHFVSELERVARDTQGREDALALVALDGENAWEHYPFNGYYFLKGLYAALADHPTLRLTTLGEFTAGHPRREQLPRVVAGSWVHGTLATWMGDRDKNAGWDLLVEAKQAADEVLAADGLAPGSRRAIERQLAQCESSDWFWWFGDYNPYEAVRDFDRLFRHQLASLYRLLGRDPPAALAHALSTGRGAPEGGGVMRRAQ
jgi:alpha-amylase/alpha-mannosidase (GH57 family)